MGNTRLRFLSAFNFRTTIRKTLLVVYFLLIVVPLSFFTSIAYNRVSNVIYNQTMASASKSFEECVDNIERYLIHMNTIMINLLGFPQLYTIASEDPLSFYIENQKTIDNLMTLMRYLKNTTGISNISIHSDYYSYTTSTSTPIINSLDSFRNQNWYRLLIKNQTNRLWFSPALIDPYTEDANIVFSYVSRISSPHELSKEIAIVRIDLYNEAIFNILKNTAFTANSVTYISDGKDIMLSNIPYVEALKYNIFDKINTETYGRWVSGKINDEKIVYNVHINRLTGWYIVSLVPMKDIISIAKQLQRDMITIMFILAVASYFLAYTMSDSSVRRLSMLTEQMKEVEKGNFNVYISKSGNDEIGRLIIGFNNMVSRIRELMDEKFKLGRDIKSMELKALQSQINPHFLYNSLDLINCIAIKNNIREIVQMVNALAKFYRISLSKGNDIIPIADEIAHVSFYITIQNLRFENKINFVKEIDSRLYEYKILKIILQPLVENAIIHGLFEKDTKEGTIRIIGRLENEDIVFIVEDDGVGMSEDTILNILNHDKANSAHGYGAYNTHCRLRLLYGNNYGLTYKSIIGKGTQAIVRLPAKKHNDIDVKN